MTFSNACSFWILRASRLRGSKLIRHGTIHQGSNIRNVDSPVTGLPQEDNATCTYPATPLYCTIPPSLLWILLQGLFAKRVVYKTSNVDNQRSHTYSY